MPPYIHRQTIRLSESENPSRFTSLTPGEAVESSAVEQPDAVISIPRHNGCFPSWIRVADLSIIPAAIVRVGNVSIKIGHEPRYLPMGGITGDQLEITSEWPLPNPDLTGGDILVGMGCKMDPVSFPMDLEFGWGEIPPIGRIEPLVHVARLYPNFTPSLGATLFFPTFGARRVTLQISSGIDAAGLEQEIPIYEADHNMWPVLEDPLDVFPAGPTGATLPWFTELNVRSQYLRIPVPALGFRDFLEFVLTVYRE